MHHPTDPRLRTSRRLAAAALALALASPAPALAGDFIDTRITFTIGDDNFLKDAGEQIPDSPRIGIGDRPGYELAFDNLNSATTGRENQLHLVLYKKIAGLIPGLTTEAAAALEFDIANQTFYDDSSYIRLVYDFRGEGAAEDAPKNHIDLVMFPLSGDRFRVGQLYDITWGGSKIFPRRERLRLGLKPTPAFKVGGVHGRFYWWAGMKMVLAPALEKISRDKATTTVSGQETENFPAVLAGVGYEPLPGLSVDLSGAYVQQGENPIEDVFGELVTAQGFSGRVAYGKGIKVALSADLDLVRNDPAYLERLFRRPTYYPGEGFKWRVALEGNAIAQVLADSEHFGATTVQWATAAALDLGGQYDYLRLNFTVLYRSIAFITLNTPSLFPFTAIPSEATKRPQVFFAAAADYHFPTPLLTAGLQGGVELPAYVETELTATKVGSNAPPTLIGRQTLLVRSRRGRFTPVVLPQDESVVPVVSARATLRWDPSEILSIIAFVQFVYDANATTLRINPDLTSTREFDDPTRLGAGITAQARF